MSPEGEGEGPQAARQSCCSPRGEGVRSAADVQEGQEHTVCELLGRVQSPPSGTWALEPEPPFSQSGCRAPHCRALPLPWQITCHLSAVLGPPGRATHSTKWREHACRLLRKEPSRAVVARLCSPLPAARSSEHGKRCLPGAPACYL